MAITSPKQTWNFIGLRWQDLSSQEDLFYQFWQDVEEMSKVQVHIIILFQFWGIQLKLQGQSKTDVLTIFGANTFLLLG